MLVNNYHMAKNYCQAQTGEVSNQGQGCRKKYQNFKDKDSESKKLRRLKYFTLNHPKMLTFIRINNFPPHHSASKIFLINKEYTYILCLLLSISRLQIQNLIEVNLSAENNLTFTKLFQLLPASHPSLALWMFTAYYKAPQKKKRRKEKERGP